MRVSEERLTAALTNIHRRVVDNDPAAAVIVERLAFSAHDHATAVRETAAFLLDLLLPARRDPSLSLPAAMAVIETEGARSTNEMLDHLASVNERDVLLSMSVHALHQASPPRRPEEAKAILRTIYLLIKICEAQEEIDALERALVR